MTLVTEMGDQVMVLWSELCFVVSAVPPDAVNRNYSPKRSDEMKLTLKKFSLGSILLLFMPLATRAVAQQPQQKKPNILFIMGDDIGWMQPSIYHEGLMVGETPNIDRIGHE